MPAIFSRNFLSLCRPFPVVLALFGMWSIGDFRDIHAAPRAIGNDEKNQRICFVSDMNGSYGSVELPQSVHAAMNRLKKLNCGLVLGAGDLVAGQQLSLTDERLRAMWGEFSRVVLQPLDNLEIPFLSALGNHDASSERSPSGQFIFDRERQIAKEFWTSKVDNAANPFEWLSREDFPFYYSVRHGTTGIIVIDGTSASEIRRKQNWLEQQLQTLAMDSSISTRIVVGHLPLLAVAKGRERPGEILADSRKLYEMFDRYKVDLYVSGHHHAYYPGRVRAWSQNHGTVQLALGALGDGARQLLGNPDIPVRNTLSFMDINPTIPFPVDKFMLNTLIPQTGQILYQADLPDSIPSLDGLGNPVQLERVNFSSPFPQP
ncbi:MAG: metallophosphoesterase family protein [Silvanigrellaceae bacterium]